MLKTVVLPAIQTIFYGEYYGLDKIILKRTDLCRTYRKVVLLGEFKTLIESYLRNCYDYEIDWCKIDRNKLLDELLNTLLLEHSNIKEADIKNVLYFDREINFINSDEYHMFSEKLITSLNDSIPVLCKLGVYEKF